MQVDLSSILAPLVMAVFAAVGALATRGLWYLADKWQVDRDGSVRAAFQEALDKSLQAGAQQSVDLIRSRGWDHPTVGNAVVSQAIQYAVTKFPDVLKKAGVDASSVPAAEAKMRDALSRAWPDTAARLVASPVTPAGLPGTGAPNGVLPAAPVGGSTVGRLGAASVLLMGVGMALSACTGAGQTQQTVAGVEIALTSAEKAAKLYVQRPPCPKVPICSDPAIVQQIKDADNTAYAAVKAARAGGDDAKLTAALVAVTALTKLIPTD